MYSRSRIAALVSMISSFFKSINSSLFSPSGIILQANRGFVKSSSKPTTYWQGNIWPKSRARCDLSADFQIQLHCLRLYVLPYRVAPNFIFLYYLAPHFILFSPLFKQTFFSSMCEGHQRHGGLQISARGMAGLHLRPETLGMGQVGAVVLRPPLIAPVRTLAHSNPAPLSPLRQERRSDQLPGHARQHFRAHV